MNDAFGDIRNATAAAISLGWPIRPSGAACSNPARTSSMSSDRFDRLLSLASRAARSALHDPAPTGSTTDDHHLPRRPRPPSEQNLRLLASLAS